MAYKCAVCGKVYDTINERVVCESECLKKAEADAAAKKKANEEKIKKELMNKIKSKIDETTALIAQYKEVTGEEPELTTTYTYSTSSDDAAKALRDLFGDIRLPNLLNWFI